MWRPRAPIGLRDARHSRCLERCGRPQPMLERSRGGRSASVSVEADSLSQCAQCRSAQVDGSGARRSSPAEVSETSMGRAETPIPDKAGARPPRRLGQNGDQPGRRPLLLCPRTRACFRAAGGQTPDSSIATLLTASIATFRRPCSSRTGALVPGRCHESAATPLAGIRLSESEDCDHQAPLAGARRSMRPPRWTASSAHP
jgi:hypothetical protein